MLVRETGWREYWHALRQRSCHQPVYTDHQIQGISAQIIDKVSFGRDICLSNAELLYRYLFNSFENRGHFCRGSTEPFSIRSQ